MYDKKNRNNEQNPGQMEHLESTGEKEKSWCKQRAGTERRGKWLHRMDDLSTGKEKHTQPQHQKTKIQKTTGVPKALSQKATGKERGKISESCWLVEWWVGGGTLRDEVDINYGYDVNLRRGEQQTAPNTEVADKQILVSPWKEERIC